jgi:sugar O-acyltransferase (sialic acid O-acetyltransferase NeuD family)
MQSFWRKESLIFRVVLDKELILIGYSGHGYVVAETAFENGFDLIGYSERYRIEKNPFNLEYLGFEKDEDFVGWGKKASFLLGIGDNALRQKIASLIESRGECLSSLVHSSASVSNSALIGSGTFINKNVSVNALVVVGKNVILNTGCIIEHECVLSDAVHIAPGAVLAGKVSVGERTFVGANAVLKQGIVIGKDVVIGAGTVVITNIPDGKKVVGNPGKII